MAEVLPQLVVKHLLAYLHVNDAVGLDLVFKQTHRFTVRRVLCYTELLVKAGVGRAQCDALPLGVVDAQCVGRAVHLVFAPPLRDAVSQV